jgi:hypothetical protein
LDKFLIYGDTALAKEGFSTTRYLMIIRLSSFFNSRKLSIAATLAAVYALGSFLPGFPLIGFPGEKIDVVRSLEMGYGFILGPVLGPLTAFLGAIVGKTMTGGGFGMFFTPLAPLSALMAAALSRRNVFKIRGWTLASGILIVLIAGWYGTSAGRAVPYYSVLHLVGLGIILVFRGKLAEYIQGEDKGKLSLGVALISYSSTIAGQMLGNLIFITLVRPSPLFFMTIFPVTLFERVVITILSTVIATPLIIFVRKLFPLLIEDRL